MSTYRELLKSANERMVEADRGEPSIFIRVNEYGSSQFIYGI